MTNVKLETGQEQKLFSSWVEKLIINTYHSIEIDQQTPDLFNRSTSAHSRLGDGERYASRVSTDLTAMGEGRRVGTTIPFEVIVRSIPT